MTRYKNWAPGEVEVGSAFRTRSTGADPPNNKMRTLSTPLSEEGPLGGPDNGTTDEVTEETGGCTQWEPAHAGTGVGWMWWRYPLACDELSGEQGQPPHMCVSYVCHS